MEQRLQKRIDYLQRILDTRFPKTKCIIAELRSIPTTNLMIVESEANTILPQELTDDGMTDIPEDELKQRDEEEQKLKDTLQQIELDKLMNRKPRVKK